MMPVRITVKVRFNTNSKIRKLSKEGDDKFTGEDELRSKFCISITNSCLSFRLFLSTSYFLALSFAISNFTGFINCLAS